MADEITISKQNMLGAYCDKLVDSIQRPLTIKADWYDIRLVFFCFASVMALLSVNHSL